MFPIRTLFIVILLLMISFPVRAEQIIVSGYTGLWMPDGTYIRVDISGFTATQGAYTLTSGSVKAVGANIYFAGKISRIWFPSPADTTLVAVEALGTGWPVVPVSGPGFLSDAVVLVKKEPSLLLCGLEVTPLDDGDEGIDGFGGMPMFSTGDDPTSALPVALQTFFGYMSIIHR